MVALGCFRGRRPVGVADKESGHEVVLRRKALVTGVGLDALISKALEVEAGMGKL